MRQRKLGIPSVIDRVVQQALVQRMEPIFEPGFAESLEGNSRQAAAVRTQSRRAASIWLAAMRRAMSASKPLNVRRSTRGRSPVR